MLFMVVGILMAVVCAAQQQTASKLSGAELLVQLRSDKWTDRANAYGQLRSDANALSDPKVQQALLDVLNEGNQLIEDVNRNPQGPSVDEKYGEDYVEYVGDLGETVDSFANWNDPRQVCIYVHEPYNPESKFAAKIASHGKVAVPCLIQMYASDVGLARAEAAPVLVQALAKSSDQLDSNTIANVKQVIQNALRDPVDAVRSTSVRALEKFGQLDMIPALERVAESDPSPEVQGYSIRKSALNAIAAIQKRAVKQ
jgi:hypothetical protein